METPILEFAQRAREAGLPVMLKQPVPEIPNTKDALGVPMDPQLVAFYRKTNVCAIGPALDCYIHKGADELVNDNLHMRRIFDELPFLHDVLIWARDTTYSIEMTSIPALADCDGRQPVIILDVNDAPIVLPLASSFNRALELVVENRIQAVRGDETREPFPYVMADTVACDTRLMQLIDTRAFHDMCPGAALEPEWLDMLCTTRDRPK